LAGYATDFIERRWRTVQKVLGNRMQLSEIWLRTRDKRGSRLDRTGSGLKPILAESGGSDCNFLKIGGSRLDTD